MSQAMDKNIYRIRGIDLDHDGVRYPEGSEIELNEEAAKSLGRRLEFVRAVPVASLSAPTPAQEPPPGESESSGSGKKR